MGADLDLALKLTQRGWTILPILVLDLPAPLTYTMARQLNKNVAC